MAIRFTDKEWEDIKSKSSGAYTSNEEELKDKAKMEHELDDDEMKKEQAKAERERKKSEREDKKFAKANPGSTFAKQYDKAHPKSNKQSQARSKHTTSKSISRTTGGAETSVPVYKSPNFNIPKSGYTPLDYKPVSGASYYKSPFGSSVPVQSKRKSNRGRISPITGFMSF